MDKLRFFLDKFNRLYFKSLHQFQKQRRYDKY